MVPARIPHTVVSVDGERSERSAETTAAGTRRIALVLVAGLMVGAATQILQGLLPGALNWIANSLSGWLVVAFLVGSRMPSLRWAAGSGPPLLLAALAGYYALTLVRLGIGGSTSSLVFWSFGALAGGIVFGATGWWWRHGGDVARAMAAGLVGALLVAEGVYFLAILPDPVVGIGAVVAGLVAPLILGRSWSDRARGELAIVPGLGLGAAGYAAVQVLYRVLTGVG